MESKVDFLKGTNLFRDLTDGEVRSVIEVLKVARFDKGDYLFVEGDDADAAYIVLSGSVTVMKEIAEGVDKVLLTARVGDVFGEMGLIEGQPRSATARAEEATEVLWLGTDVFRNLIAREPSVASRILVALSRVLSGRLRVTTDDLAESVRWSHDVSGVSRLSFHEFVGGTGSVVLALRNGTQVRGRILRVEEQAGRDLVVRTDDGVLVVIPYHAVDALEFDADTVPVTTRVDPGGEVGLERRAQKTSVEMRVPIELSLDTSELTQ